jgi:hypothetical protein
MAKRGFVDVEQDELHARVGVECNEKIREGLAFGGTTIHVPRSSATHHLRDVHR